MKKLLTVTALLVGIAFGAVAFYVQREWRTPYPDHEQSTIIEIPRGLGAREIVKLLEDRRIIRNRYAALAYIVYTGSRNKLQAGEYLFDRPMTVPEVVDKFASGAIHLHRFTVPEGLTIATTALRWEEQGFGLAEDFRRAAEGAVEFVRRFDPEAESVEGYLFPETYSLPAGTTARHAIEAMVMGFQRVRDRLEQAVSAANWPLNLRETVILASLIETEAAHDDERPLIASVFLNRLSRRMLLQADPTVVYALDQANQYRGRLLRADLQFPSPYNTYVHPGLPPGPIANPGYSSLLAAVQPTETNLLYFVRTLDGRHTFSETLAAHNRAVEAYRRMRQ